MMVSLGISYDNQNQLSWFGFDVCSGKMNEDALSDVIVAPGYIDGFNNQLWMTALDDIRFSSFSTGYNVVVYVLFLTSSPGNITNVDAILPSQWYKITAYGVDGLGFALNSLGYMHNSKGNRAKAIMIGSFLLLSSSMDSSNTGFQIYSDNLYEQVGFVGAASDTLGNIMVLLGDSQVAAK